jgi:hypothetical protein
VGDRREKGGAPSHFPAKTSNFRIPHQIIKKQPSKEKHYSDQANSNHLQSEEAPPNVAIMPSPRKVALNIGDVGYTFRKKFDAGWFTGKVVEIRPGAGELCGCLLFLLSYTSMLYGWYSFMN